MKQLRWIFGLTALATLALIGLQAYIWHQGIRQEREQFGRALQHAVFEATEEFMRPLESAILLSTVERDTSYFRRPGFIALQIGQADSNVTIDIEHTYKDTTDAFLTIVDETETGPTGIIRRLERHRIERIDTLHNWSTAIFTDSLNQNFFIRHKEFCPSCQTGFTRLSSENFKPLLEKELQQLQIDTEFQWGVQHMDNWLIAEGDTASLLNSKWQFPFFAFPAGTLEHTLDLSASSSMVAAGAMNAPTIMLYFPWEHLLMLRSMGPTLMLSSTLVLLVLGCIGYGLFVILRQKQLSEIKTDFINNMTHELKTPISTIALACEAMQDSEVDLPPASRKHYLQMISTENERLGTQVEKVLQMALLDKKDLGLRIEPVHVHTLLDEIVDAFTLQITHRSGSITTALKASNDCVEADRMHLRQMFTNLLDNANKYSPDSPEIVVETTSLDDGIEIAIHDKGLGISRDALRKIFDRFYRVPTGNRHDVKGFGLGLSYVQTMALAHGGQVYARSKPGAGSSFYLYLPYAHA